MSSSVASDVPAEVEIDANNEALVARVQECIAHPLVDSFRDSLDRLARLAKNFPGGKVKLWPDFAPLSFDFVVLRGDGSRWINGGLIFHGAHDGGGNGGAPTYAVCVTPTDGWSIHT